ncbi:hypothetical protein F5Y17DRAFT_113165 [Xylariaceae sp. FL0594]|nr:hypothetical protein F5Y17DRAFT_113165 [Xylariaceae sp. FL0594]
MMRTEDLDDTRIRPSYFKIPTDQKTLLARDESWASLRRPIDYPNAPSDVLEGVKRAYALRIQNDDLPKASPPAGPANGKKSTPEPTGSDSDGIREGNGREEDDEHEEEELISWPPSADEANVDSSLPAGNPSSPQFLTQMPEKSTQPPTALTSSPTRSRTQPERPESSSPGLEENDDLELQIPAAPTHALAPFNRPTVPIVTTPPSAQIVVPSTLEHHTASHSAAAHVGLKRRKIYKEVPELYRPRKQIPSAHLHINPLTEPVPSSDNTDLESSLSTDMTPSPIIPSTHDNRSAQDRASTPQNRPASMCLPPSSVGRVLTASGAAPKSLVKDYFMQYSATYPSYNGTKMHFIYACVYIQTHQSPKVKPGLYDDFIRAWVKYLPYVADCDVSRPPKRAMGALEWYNTIDDEIYFTSGVITPQNLDSVLDSYPKEVEDARRALSLPPPTAVHHVQVSQPRSVVSPGLEARPRVRESTPPARSLRNEAPPSSVAASASIRPRLSHGGSVDAQEERRRAQERRQEQERRQKRLEKHFRKKALADKRSLVSSTAPPSNGSASVPR